MSLHLLSIFSLDDGSLFPAACMSSNFCYILDIVDNVIKCLSRFFKLYMGYRG